MWMRKGEQIIPLALNLPDLPARLRADGWVEVPDPGAMPMSDLAAAAQPPPEPPSEPEPQRSPLPPLDFIADRRVVPVDIPIVLPAARQSHTRGRR